MTTLEQISETGKSPKLKTGRRSFIWKAGAAISAMAASAVANVSKPKVDETDFGGQVEQLSKQLGILQDENAIRELHKVYEGHFDKGGYEDVVGMFADDAKVVYNGGLFAGKEGVRRLYCNHFALGLTGKKMESAPGFDLNPGQQPDGIEVAADRRTATGRFPYSIQVGEPMTSNSSLVEMARLQGEGIAKWWEGGIYEASYVKIGESWKIKMLEFRAASKASYRPGQTYAKPIDVPAFSSVFPKNPTGPDKLV